MWQLNQRLNAEAEKKAAKKAARIRLVEQKKAEEAKVSEMSHSFGSYRTDIDKWNSHLTHSIQRVEEEKKAAEEAAKLKAIEDAKKADEAKVCFIMALFNITAS